MSGFDIRGKHVGDGAPCFIVGEVAQAHEGSLTLAHSYIDAIADAGADAVKMQAHLAAAESTPDEPWRVEPKWKQDASRYDYWKRMEFTPEQWRGLSEHAHELGLAFIVSPFSVEAVRMLDGLVDAWKVASGEVKNGPLLRAIVETGTPIIASTGMSTRDEVLETMSRFWGDGWVWANGRLLLSSKRRRAALLHCVSEYPTAAEHVGLNLLAEMRRHYMVPIGLSDHSGTIYAGLAAVALGCDLLEVHVTFSREMQGFDTSSSITTQELRQLVEGVRFIEKAKTPVDKDALARELEPTRKLFMEKHKRKAESLTVRPAASPEIVLHNHRPEEQCDAVSGCYLPFPVAKGGPNA